MAHGQLECIILTGRKKHLECHQVIGTKVEPEELTKRTTFSDWDFDTVWNIDEGTTTPYLRWLGAIN